MTQSSEDEVWEQILANANQLTFCDDEQLFPKDKESEKIVDEKFCSCNNQQEFKSEAGGDVFYVCKTSLGGCGKEIKK